MYQLIRFSIFGLTILPDELIYVMSCYLCPNLVCRISMFAWSLISLSVSCGLRELGGAWTDVYITRCREPGRQDLEWQAEQKHFSRASFLALSLDQTHREGHKRGEAVVLPPTLNRHHPEKELSPACLPPSTSSLSTAVKSHVLPKLMKALELSL